MSYRIAAEFHELFHPRAWESLALPLQRRLGSLADTAVVVDLGAGSGIGLLTIAAGTRARLVAVEPDPTMRAALMARLATNDALARRTTVLAAAVPEAIAALPARIDGAVAAHMIGHLDPADRGRLWVQLLPRMASGAPLLVSVSPPVDPDSGPTQDAEPVVEHRQIGEHRYTATYQTLPRYGGRRGYRCTYRVVDGDEVLREIVDDGDWIPVTALEIAREVEPLGWHVSATEHPLLIELTG